MSSRFYGPMQLRAIDKIGNAMLPGSTELPRFSAAARERAVERFSLEPWLARHAEIFERLAPK